MTIGRGPEFPLNDDSFEEEYRKLVEELDEMYGPVENLVSYGKYVRDFFTTEEVRSSLEPDKLDFLNKNFKSIFLKFLKVYSFDYFTFQEKFKKDNLSVEEKAIIEDDFKRRIGIFIIQGLDIAYQEYLSHPKSWDAFNRADEDSIKFVNDEQGISRREFFEKYLSKIFIVLVGLISTGVYFISDQLGQDKTKRDAIQFQELRDRVSIERVIQEIINEYGAVVKITEEDLSQARFQGLNKKILNLRPEQGERILSSVMEIKSGFDSLPSSFLDSLFGKLKIYTGDPFQTENWNLEIPYIDRDIMSGLNRDSITLVISQRGERKFFTIFGLLVAKYMQDRGIVGNANFLLKDNLIPKEHLERMRYATFAILDPSYKDSTREYYEQGVSFLKEAWPEDFKNSFK